MYVYAEQYTYPLKHIYTIASLAQLGERQTEDLKVPGSIPGGGITIYM